MDEVSNFLPPGQITGPVEETVQFAPKFNDAGLIPAIVTDAQTSELLMMAWMNAEALTRTLETGQAWYWSRSRQELWRKGATSGNTQAVIELRTDCDQDALQIVVQQTGPACHTGRRRCFYRVVPKGQPGALQITDDKTS